jgi:hypothetical protein
VAISLPPTSSIKEHADSSFLPAVRGLRLIRRRLAGVERAVAGAGASLEVVDAPDLAISAGREIGRQMLLSQVTGWGGVSIRFACRRCYPGGD